MKNIKNILLFVLIFCNLPTEAQDITITGTVVYNDKYLPYARVEVLEVSKKVLADDKGHFNIDIPAKKQFTLRATHVGFDTVDIKLTPEDDLSNVKLHLSTASALNQITISGTMKEVYLSEAPVPVEVYSGKYFKKNPNPTVFEALQHVNGVRPQLNCSVCNTGDIHINGLEGPYTMILIDGMPIVSGLSTVYGLSAIPTSLIERIEVIKGPASSLYGSEAVAGLINVITKKPESASRINVDYYATSWQEHNLDLGITNKVGKKAHVLTGGNVFYYDTPMDLNNDNFTDVTLQKRTSIFQKWNFKRQNNYLFSVAGRFLMEDRWGGEMNWNKEFYGTDSIYGENINTRRWEVFGSYQLPFKEKIITAFSSNYHSQRSAYGTTIYNADQYVNFLQAVWDKSYTRHDLILGVTLRYTYYDDNTVATSTETGNSHLNNPDKILLPGFFIQDEIKLTETQSTLLGFRIDHNSEHGLIYTPRFAYKYNPGDKTIFRVNAGTGFRVVNLFTEDHAALTGSRTIEIKETLKPERSYNVNLNYLQKIFKIKNTYASIDLSAWCTYFTNAILPDYESDPNKIIYDNLDGYSVSKGLSSNIDLEMENGLSLRAGATLMDVSVYEDDSRTNQILTEKFSANWTISYSVLKQKLTIDYTGNLYSPMRLPVLGAEDPRPDISPWWSIQNVQLTYKSWKRVEIYGGIKNLLNWTPADDVPFLIARSQDPFDKEVTYDANGSIEKTPVNPYGLTFDPTYVYAANQGIRFFIGLRYSIK